MAGPSGGARRMSKSPNQLDPKTQETIRLLLEETGHALTVEDWDDIARLNRCAVAIAHPEEQAETDLLNLPVWAGNAALRKPSLAKVRWYESCACEWFKDSDLLLELSLGYLLCTPNDSVPSVLDALPDAERTRVVVDQWARGLTCTQEEFSNALTLVLPQADDPTGERVKYGPTCALLAHEYPHAGGAAYYFNEAHIDLCRALLGDYMMRMQEQARAAQRSAGGGRRATGGTPRPRLPVQTPTMHQHKRYRELTNELRVKWQKQK